jgi:multiple sugar transport system permease protein
MNAIVKKWFHRDGTWAVLLLLPNIIGFLVFTLIPVNQQLHGFAP